MRYTISPIKKGKTGFLQKGCKKIRAWWFKRFWHLWGKMLWVLCKKNRKKNFFLKNRVVQKKRQMLWGKISFFWKTWKKGWFLHDLRIKNFFEFFQNLGVKNFGFQNEIRASSKKEQFFSQNVMDLL